MQSIAAFLVAEGVVAEPTPFRRRGGSKPGLVTRLRRRIRPSATADPVDAWVEVPALTDYPVAR